MDKSFSQIRHIFDSHMDLVWLSLCLMEIWSTASNFSFPCFSSSKAAHLSHSLFLAVSYNSSFWLSSSSPWISWSVFLRYLIIIGSIELISLSLLFKGLKVNCRGVRFLSVGCVCTCIIRCTRHIMIFRYVVRFILSPLLFTWQEDVSSLWIFFWVFFSLHFILCLLSLLVPFSWMICLSVSFSFRPSLGTLVQWFRWYQVVLPSTWTAVGVALTTL